MEVDQFTKLIKEVVSQAAVEDTIANLESPPGRRPSESLVKHSAWYNSLSSENQLMLKQVLIEAVDEAIFGLFCVVDGARSISEVGQANNITLSVNGKALNSSSEFLHDSYKNV
ncbi:hypothetical protein ACMZOO_00845 [Catenovulum sp. SX2]|uniref:hypothetical protein n=1 Tax=Catenovulum sp. SX2 TaxID=3398614 RepID=UPI003F8572FB